ncbi:MAG TPA: 2Fe-2S iron-sulfur cluster binding domain-containing protein [Casimicrobiaceae bacterium]
MRVSINARNRTFSFDAQPTQRILYAGLADGVRLPYECGSGTCGTCRARLLSGQVVDAWPNAPGKRYLRHPDECLMCQSLPQGDCALEVSSFVYPMEPGECTPAFSRGVIRNPRSLTPDVIGFDVELDRPCEFDAGQFMVIQVPGIYGYRGYSMTNFERGARTLRFVVKNKPGGGVSNWLFAGSVEGANVELYGPLGRASFDPKLTKDLVLIGGGSGIAGLLSILARACQERYFERHDGHVFFGVRSLGDAFCLDELAARRRQSGDRLSITVALSEGEVTDDATRSHPDFVFETGLVHDVARRRMQGRLRNARAYVAGPPPAVDAAIRMLLLDAKLTADSIRYDKFS